MASFHYKCAISSAEYAALKAIKWTEIFPYVTFQTPQTTFVGKPKISYKFEQNIPPAGVLETENTSVFMPNGWMVDNSGFFLADHTWFGIAHCDELNPPNADYEIETLKGLSCNLLSDWASTNYGHLLLDVIPRIDLVFKAGFKLADFDNFIVPNGFKGAMNMYEKLGIDASKVKFVQKPLIYNCEKIIAPSFPGARRTTTDWAVKFLQDSFQKPNKPVKKIYIPRTTSRKIVNEAELINLLNDYGFEVYDPQYSTSKKVFSEAAIIIGASGAGLTDVVFSPRNSTLIELVPTDHIYPYFLNAAAAARVRHISVSTQSLGISDANRVGPSEFNSIINLEFVKAALDVISNY